ncbi:MAG: hypothetical protein ABFC84_06030 [Veillonellales bacterium]
MTDKHSEWLQINQAVPKLPADKQETVRQELKRSGSVDLPVKYTETHLEDEET